MSTQERIFKTHEDGTRAIKKTVWTEKDVGAGVFSFSLHRNQICHQNAYYIPGFSKSSVDV